MIKDFIWVIYSMGGLIGLVSRNRDATPPEPEDVIPLACRYADGMWAEYKKRNCEGWKSTP